MQDKDREREEKKPWRQSGAWRTERWGDKKKLCSKYGRVSYEGAAVLCMVIICHTSLSACVSHTNFSSPVEPELAFDPYNLNGSNQQNAIILILQLS